ncbi:serine/threonine-protein kinase [Kitasatospora mediocidica]|uniref:serine/threonine-protein kinase n=1 Tax=Kitasatospora mediocidica TaxID=58352 RepID=UPI0005670F29|nr:serine/threonine-protein kinase [Kitasatospora mediocidica]
MNNGGPQTRLIDGRFELLQQLGGGGMGLVWRARDSALHREVALKEVRTGDPAMAAADPAGQLEMRERVLREARSLARLQHPNVVIIHHIVDTAEHPHPWLVMELVGGGSLADRLAQGPLTVPEAARIGRGVLSALRAAHAAGIQHRDVKPGNVLLRTDGTPVLTDFGIAAVHGSATLTATGALIGSPEYIAPERIRGEEGNPSSDLWSLGMMLYVAVEGYHPLRRATTLATLAAVLDEPLPPPVRSGQLGPMLSALLARDPAQRPDADQLDRLLAAAEQGAGQAGPGPAPWAPTFLDTPSPFGPAAGAAAPTDRLPSSVFGPPVPLAKDGPLRPPARSRRGRTVLGTTSVVVCAAVIGALVWTMEPSTGHTSLRASGSGSPGVVAPGTATPGTAASGGAQAAPPASAGAAATPAPKDLLTPDGMRATVAAISPLMTNGRVVELVVYPGYASAEVPTAADPLHYDQVDYRDGAVTHSPGGSVDTGENTTVDLRGYDWDLLPSLLQKAQATLNVANPTSRYVIVGPDILDGTPSISVYLSDAYDGSGYLETDTKGNVKRSHPRGS